ncbi:hypothetical protein Ancab_026602 [Ancistrocladus abbreviatus]
MLIRLSPELNWNPRWFREHQGYLTNGKQKRLQFAFSLAAGSSSSSFKSPHHLCFPGFIQTISLLLWSLPSAKMRQLQFPPSILFLLLSLLPSVNSTTFTFVNKCSYTIWPGVLSNAGTPQLSTTGFSLQSGSSATLPVPPSWSGRIWARTLCTIDSTTNKFSCVTADCGSGTVQCSGNGASPPASLAEFTLDGANGLDFYDVSLVDGYNLPLLIMPVGGTGNCTAAGCIGDLNQSCPTELRVVSSDYDDGGEGVACRSACDALGDPQYCCSGAYATPSTCKPTSYSEYFKNACPTAYSYAYDDATSTFTCAGADYVITFCPTATTTARKSSGQETVSPGPGLSPSTASVVIPATALATLSVLWLSYSMF